MKRWVFLTVAVYLITLVVIILPLALLAFGKWGPAGGISVSEALAFYKEWGYWVWVGVMGLGQALLLIAPVAAEKGRPLRRRSLIVPVVTTAFFLANLLVAAGLSIACVLMGDRAFDMFGLFGEVTLAPSIHGVLTSLLKSPDAIGKVSFDYIFGMIEIVGLIWIVWAVIFFMLAKGDNAHALVQRTRRWLLSGSILELLIAVPSHIIVRNRPDCCAPLGTFWGITTGVSIMLLCFGPGVYFLFAERFKRLRPKQDQGPP